MTAVPNWQPGKLYQPGALVIPRASTTLTSGVLINGDFEDGDTGWIKGTRWNILNAVNVHGAPFQGAYYAQFSTYPVYGGSFTADTLIVNERIVPVTPGQVISLKAMIASASGPADAGVSVRILFWDAASSGGYGSPGAVLVEEQSGASINGSTSYQASNLTAVAPPGAAYAQFCIHAYSNNYPADINVDSCSWDYAGITAPTGLVFKAVQANAATSASIEPVWPTVLGNTVVDGGVTWEAVQSTQVTWEATPILVSGGSEPTWSTDVGGTVADNTIAWKAISRRITDEKCPNTIAVAIAASKIFAGDDDIIPFSETVNPLDWSTPNDAGYLPFGLQTYGSSPVTALGLYRSNLVAFNAAAFQMWQVDQDPANMALLDAVPVGCVYPKSVQPLANDLIFLSVVGVRNVSIAGASTNLQAGGIGEPVDPLVVAQIRTDLYDPISLFFPAAGQYWLIFGVQAFVLTITSSKTSSWSRYIFPSVITDWTLMGSDLYLRSSTKVWHFSADALYDDVIDPTADMTIGGAPGVSLLMVTGNDDGSLGYEPGIGSLTPNTLTLGTVGFILWNGATTLSFHIDGSGLTQSSFTSLAFTGDTGALTLNTSAVDSYGGGTWNWTVGASPFTEGESYTLTVNLGAAGTYTGYDAYNGIGTLDSSTLVGHTLLRAAIKRSTGEFELQLSDIEDANTAFENMQVFRDSTLSETLELSGATITSIGTVTIGMTTYTNVVKYVWASTATYLDSATTLGVEFNNFIDPASKVDFTGTIQWPHLDMGQIGIEKNMIGIDLMSDAPTGVTFSIGYDQRDLTKRTAAYAIDADTLPGPLMPIPVSGPSFDLKLEFAAGQAWEHIAANLYIK